MRKLFCSKRFSAHNFVQLITTVALASTITLNPVYSQQIVVDGKTKTSLNINDKVTHVYTNTIKGKNALNSFERFNVNKGNTVNLVVPNKASNLINLVHNEKSTINGVLNSIKNGKIGGNIFFANPHGVLVGKEGVINVGSLTITTPTTSAMNSFFDSKGNINDTAVSGLLNGTLPVNPEAEINVQGNINAIESVKLDTGTLINAGNIYTGAVFEENDIDIGDVVNVNTLESGDDIAVNNGEIIITTTNNFINRGNIVADGGNNVDGGNISIVAGQDIILEPGSLVSAKGKGENSSGGDIYIWGDHDSYFNKGAILDARGGNVSGDGGFIELSAKEFISIDGGVFRAKSYKGNSGTILVDPDDLIISANNYSDGSNITYTANDSITVNTNIIISSRDLDDPNNDDHDTDPSEGDSGNISFTSPKITFNSGSKVYAHGNNGYTGGIITIDASGTGLSGSGVSIGGTVKTNSDVYITSSGSIIDANDDDNPNVIGKSITLTAGGAIGSSENYLEINTDPENTGAGTLTASSNGYDIYVEEVNADGAPDNLRISEINAGSGNVYLKAFSSILSEDLSSIIVANNIKLIANKNIGNSTIPIRVQSGGSLIAKSLGSPIYDIYITETTGDLRINSIIAPDIVQISAAGSIIDANDDDNPNVIGKSITLTAGGAIGSSDNYLDIEPSGELTVEANDVSDPYDDSIYIKSHQTGDLKIHHVKSYHGDVYISSVGNILDNRVDDYSNVTGKNINILSTSGNVGSIENELNIRAAYSGYGHITIEADGLIRIKQRNANMSLNSVKSNNGDVYIYAEKDIIDTDENDISPVIIGNDITITSEETIGSSDNYLDIEPSGELTVEANDVSDPYDDSIYIKSHQTGDLKIHHVKSYHGDVYITSSGSIIDANDDDNPNIVADSITLTAGGNIGSSENYLDIDSDSDNDGNNGTLSATTSNGSIYIYEVGDGGTTPSKEALFVNSITAKDEIYLRADYQIQNYNGSIETTADNSIITLVTDNTQLYDDGVEETITTGTGGTIKIQNASSGDMNLGGGATGHIISQNEINTLNSDNIEIGDTTNTADMYLYLADFSVTNSAGTGPSNISLLAAGSIIDANDDDNPNIVADSITLIAGGNIGSSENYLDINTSFASNGSFNATTTDQNIFIKEYSDDLSVNSVDAGTGDVYITSSGSIIDANDDDNPNIVADSITLTAGGAIGSSDNYLDIEPSGELTVEANDVSDPYDDSIYIKSHQTGDLKIHHVKSYHGDVYITSSGSIIDANDDDNPNIVADSITLTAGGNIGSSENYLDIDSDSDNDGNNGTLSATTSNGSIYIYEVGDGGTTPSKEALFVNSITAKDEIYLRADYQIQNYNGSIETTADNSIITLVTDNTQLYDDGVEETITTGTGGTIKIQNASSGDMNLGGGATGHIISQNEINTLNSDNIEIGDTTNTADMYLYLADFSATNSAGTGPSNISLLAAGSIIDANDDDNPNIVADSITLTAGGNIGSSENYLDIDSDSDNDGNNGTLTADALDGSIFIYEVGDGGTTPSKEALFVNSITAKDEIYLRADWEIQNHGGTIKTTATNSKIALETNNTQLYEELLSGSDDIQTGTDGSLEFKRPGAGDLWVGYSGSDNDANSPVSGTSFVTNNELGTVDSDIIINITPSSGNIIISDDFPFSTNPVDVGNETLYILRESAGDLTLGGNGSGNGHIIEQSEIDNITADAIHFGNVLDSDLAGDTQNIYLIYPDFSKTGSNDGPSDVVLIAYDSILDFVPNEEPTTSSLNALQAKDLTLKAATQKNGEQTDEINLLNGGTIGGSGPDDIDIKLLNNGVLNGKAYGYIGIQNPNIPDQDNYLHLGKLESTNSDVSLFVGGVYINDGKSHSGVNKLLNAGTEEINIKAKDNITIKSYYVCSYNYQTFYRGNLGTNNNFIKIDTDSNSDGIGAVTIASGTIYVEETAGNLPINIIKQSASLKPATTVYLKANDSNGADILDANNDDTYNIFANEITLEALYGSIGSGGIGDNGALGLYGSQSYFKALAGTAITSEEVINLKQYNTRSNDPSILIDIVETNSNSTVNIYSQYGSIADYQHDDGSEVVDIIAKNINLKAGTDDQIGKYWTGTGRILRRPGIQLLNGGKLYAQAYDEIFIHSDGDMNIEEINLTTDSAHQAIVLSAGNGGSILNAREDSGYNISAKSVDLILNASNDIGSSSKPLELYINTRTGSVNWGYLKAVANNDIYLNNSRNDSKAITLRDNSAGGTYNLTSKNTIYIESVVAGNDITINAADDTENPNIYLGKITAGSGSNWYNITLNADGDILHNTLDTYHLKGAAINLTAGGDIGSTDMTP